MINTGALKRYIDSLFFQQALNSFAEEFEDPEVALSHTMHIFRHIGPVDTADWVYHIETLFGVLFDFYWAGYHDTPTKLSETEFLKLVENHPDQFIFNEDGILYDAVEAAIEGGMSAYPPYIPRLRPAVDMKATMARIYHAMFLDDGSDTDVEGLGVTLDEPCVIAFRLRDVFGNIFHNHDDRYFSESRCFSTTACAVFWRSFGFAMDERGLPIVFWN